MTTWTIPTLKLVEQTLASLTDVNLRAMFFSGLENPEWLPPLRDLGVFTAEPGSSPNSQGDQVPQPWAEGDYLVRVAAAHPTEVVELLAGHGASDNPWVQRVLVSGAAELPASSAVDLVPALVRIIRSGAAWLDVPKLVSIAEQLSEGGHGGATRRLLGALFEPGAPTNDEGEPFPREVRTSINAYFYASLLPRAVPLLVGFERIEGLKLVGGWLMRARFRPSASDDPPYDVGSIWRPSTAPHTQNLRMDEPGDGLIDAVRDVALGLSSAGRFTEVLAYLDRSKSFLIRRIGLEVAAQVLSADSTPEAIDTGFDLLMDETLMNITARPDYVHLARALLPRLDQDRAARWTALVQSQTWMGPEEGIRRMVAWMSGDVDSVTDDEIIATKERMRQRLLQPLSGVLPSQLAEELERLVAQVGEIPHPEFSSYTESFTGPTSPKSSSELEQMTASELGSYLKAWQPANGYSFGPTIEGLARELEIVATNSPELLEGLAPGLVELGRSYVRATVTGWTKAIANGFHPGDPAWTIVSNIVTMSDDDNVDALNFDEHDSVWRYSQRAAVDFIAAYVRTLQHVADDEVARLWELLRPLIDHPDPSRESGEESGRTSMDPMTRSLNELRPSALRTGIVLVAASHRGDPGDPSDVEQTILRTIADHVGVDADASLSVAAVVGEGLGRLWGVDPGWVEAREGVLFAVCHPDTARRVWADVAVSVALRSYQTGIAFLRLMRPALAQMFTAEYFSVEHEEGWRERESAVETAALHLLRGFLFDLIELDDPDLERFFGQTVPDDLKSNVLGLLGWLIMQWNQGEERVQPAVAERAMQLVESRVAKMDVDASAMELAKFFWWARSGAFAPSWWLPILKVVVEKGVAEANGMLGEPLAEAAKLEPGLTLEVFELLLSGRLDDWHGYDLLRNAPVILAAALSSGDDDVVQHARSFQDRLGREGHLGILEEVDQRLAANATDDDSDLTGE